MVRRMFAPSTRNSTLNSLRNWWWTAHPAAH
ncbi:trp operon leader peptide [Streptomyces sp. NPDC002588]